MQTHLVLNLHECFTQKQFYEYVNLGWGPMEYVTAFCGSPLHFNDNIHIKVPMEVFPDVLWYWNGQIPLVCMCIWHLRYVTYEVVQGFSNCFKSYISFQYISLCQDTRGHALQIVEAFLHPRNCVHAPIAGVPSERSPWAFYPAVTSQKLPAKL